MSILVTGSAGFIGYHTAKRLIKSNEEVIGLDNFSNYYDVSLKESRWKMLEESPNFNGIRSDISNLKNIKDIFLKFEPKKVIHMAAQAGVRDGYKHPQMYTQSNLVGMINILDCCKTAGVNQLIYASSSAVYGNSQKLPYSENNHLGMPLSVYAATKQSNEAMAYSFSNLYSIPITALRLFTVYGPWGRPDMAIYNFTSSILNEKEILLYGRGRMKRDFTFINDTVEGIIRSMSPKPKPQALYPPYNVFNIGAGKPIEIINLIKILENELNKKAILKFKESHFGEMKSTWSDVTKIKNEASYTPKTSLEEGIKIFVKWFRNYYQI